MSSKPKRLERVFWVVLLVAILVHLAVYLLVAYPAMPEMVPIHWSVGDAAGEWSPKWVTIITAALPLPILLLVFLVPRMTPRGATSITSVASIWVFLLPFRLSWPPYRERCHSLPLVSCPRTGRLSPRSFSSVLPCS